MYTMHLFENNMKDKMYNDIYTIILQKAWNINDGNDADRTYNPNER